jgi:anti-anti-sigma factor
MLEQTAFRADVVHTPRGVLVNLAGPLGMLESDRLQATLRGVIAGRPPLVVFDCADLTLIASLGMGALVSFQKSMRLHGGVVRLAQLRPAVLTALRHARLEDVFQIADLVEDALGPVACQPARGDGGASP